MAATERTRNLLMSIPVAAETWIPEGVMVAVNADGYGVPASKTEGLKVAGVSKDYADNRLGLDGGRSILVKRGAWQFKNAGDISGTDLLKTCYISDSGTVTLTAEGSSEVGTIIQVEDSGVTVDIM